MQSSVCILVRQGANQPWGFRLLGGTDYGKPLTVQKIASGSIAEHRGLQTGDAILQIGRERTVDMTHEDAQDAIVRSRNRLDLVVLRPLPVVYKNHINKQPEKAQIRALVHKQFNSPMGLYSTENIADSIISQAQVLTNGRAVGLDYKAMNAQTVKRTEVYRMVHEEDDEEEESSSSSASPSPTYMRRQAPPAAPPKPAVQPQPQYRAAPPPQQQYQQPPSPQQQYHQPAAQQQYRQPPPQQQQRQPPPQQQQYRQPPPQQQQQQYRQPPPQQQQQYRQPPVQQPQYDKDRYAAPSQQVNHEPQNYYKPAQNQPNAAPHHPVGSKPGPTFQSIIPVQSSTQPYANEIHWTPTEGHQLPVWPPQKSDAPIPTSSQSVKWSGSSGAPKKFIWPPPKDFVEVREVIEGDKRRTIYTHVKDPIPNPARVYVSPRAPAKLAAEAWIPYSNEYREVIPPSSGRVGRPIRRFDDLFSSNSTRLPPTYRAPPGTSHIAA